MVSSQDSSIDEISRLVQEHIPKAALQRSHAGEISYLLPLADVSKFPGYLITTSFSLNVFITN